jgi:hypothetical protein
MTGKCMCPGNKLPADKGTCPKGEGCHAHHIKGKLLASLYAVFTS